MRLGDLRVARFDLLAERLDPVGDLRVGFVERAQVLGAGLQVVEAVGLKDDGEVVLLTGLVDVDETIREHVDGALVTGLDLLEPRLRGGEVFGERFRTRLRLLDLRLQLHRSGARGAGIELQLRDLGGLRVHLAGEAIDVGLGRVDLVLERRVGGAGEGDAGGDRDHAEHGPEPDPASPQPAALKPPRRGLVSVSASPELLPGPAGLAVGLAPKEWRYANAMRFAPSDPSGPPVGPPLAAL